MNPCLLNGMPYGQGIGAIVAIVAIGGIAWIVALVILVALGDIGDRTMARTPPKCTGGEGTKGDRGGPHDTQGYEPLPIERDALRARGG